MSDGNDSGARGSNRASGARNASGVRQSSPRRMLVVGAKDSPKSLRRICVSERVNCSALFSRFRGSVASGGMFGTSLFPSRWTMANVSGWPNRSCSCSGERWSKLDGNFHRDIAQMEIQGRIRSKRYIVIDIRQHGTNLHEHTRTNAYTKQPARVRRTAPAQRQAETGASKTPGGDCTAPAPRRSTDGSRSGHARRIHPGGEGSCFFLAVTEQNGSTTQTTTAVPQKEP